MDASKLYDDDFVLWTEQQASALRQLAGASNSLDIEHLAEEIEDLGKRDVREVESLLRMMFVHGLKIALSPDSSYVPHWRAEIVAFQQSARAAFTPSMRQLVVVGAHWQSAIKVIAAEQPKRYRQDMLDSAGNSLFPAAIDAMMSSAYDLDTFLNDVTHTVKSIPSAP